MLFTRRQIPGWRAPVGYEEEKSPGIVLFSLLFALGFCLELHFDVLFFQISTHFPVSPNQPRTNTFVHMSIVNE